MLDWYNLYFNSKHNGMYHNKTTTITNTTAATITVVIVVKATHVT
jgi:hypothetical protein